MRGKQVRSGQTDDCKENLILSVKYLGDAKDLTPCHDF
jgi:hypothetical protein